jgi:hypothetical protein
VDYEGLLGVAGKDAEALQYLGVPNEFQHRQEHVAGTAVDLQPFDTRDLLIELGLVETGTGITTPGKYTLSKTAPRIVRTAILCGIGDA